MKVELVPPKPQTPTVVITLTSSEAEILEGLMNYSGQICNSVANSLPMSRSIVNTFYVKLWRELNNKTKTKSQDDE